MEKLKYDPVEQVEKTIKDINDKTGKKTQNLFKKYPVFFSLIITFAVVSILHGFELIFDNMPVIKNNPWILILIGVIILVITGSVYKSLNK